MEKKRKIRIEGIESHDHKFNLGDLVTDVVTGFTGVVTSRSQWLNGCNTYGVQPTELKDGAPLKPESFDEPQLSIVEEKVVEGERETGGNNPVPTRPGE